MTESEDEAQRPISVAELLARNGGGDNKIGGHRRRMRGNADAIPVAELTGEIPVIRDKKGRTRPNPAPASETAPPPRAAEPVVESASGRSYLQSTAPALFGGDSFADEAARRGANSSTPSAGLTAEATVPPTERPSEAPTSIRSIFPPTATPVARPGEVRKSIDSNDATGVIEPVTAEPKPIDDEPRETASVIKVTDTSLQDPALVPAVPEVSATALPVEHGRHSEELEEDFGHELDYDRHSGDIEGHGDQTHDESGSRSESDLQPTAALSTVDDEAPPKGRRRSRLKTFLHAAWITTQYLVAAAVGAALFVAFRELWQWNMGIAFVVGLLFVLILVTSLWVIRKTVDLISILVAILVGALIAFGPLVLLLTTATD